MAKKVMIVDDEESVRYTVSTILGTEGYGVVAAKNREEAFEKLKEEPVDLILLDVMMPGMRPIDFINKLKTNEKWSKIKVAYLSVVTFTEESKQGMIDKGVVVDYITKPFDNKELVDKVKEMIGEPA